MNNGERQSSSLYSDVPTSEDEDNIEMKTYGGNGFEDEDDVLAASDVGAETTALRRSQRRPPNNPGSSMGFLLFAWVLALPFFIGGALILMRMRRTAHESSLNERSGVVDSSNAIPTAQPTRSPVHHDSSVLSTKWDPFNLTTGFESDVSPFIPRAVPWVASESRLGYLRQPDMVNDTLVFVSEGDLYWTRIGDRMPAAKLTTTAGNVLTPKINPFQPHLIAYTATYHGRRDVYLLNLQAGGTAQRLTYWPSGSGVRSVTRWVDASTILFSASHLESNALPDERVFQLSLSQTEKSSHPALQISPVPLAQALDGVFVPDSGGNCFYFTRFKQSSHTARYVGGTAESIWMYCSNHTEAVEITSDYPGTSKSPSVLYLEGAKYLVFASDRGIKNSEDWVPTSMNLWAMPLPTEDVYESSSTKFQQPKQLTRISCDYDGLALQQYALDPVTSGIVLRIGADLHLFTVSQIKGALHNGQISTPSKLEVQVISDFHELQERIVEVSLPASLTGMDAYATSFGSINSLLTIRGQSWVVPVQAETKGKLRYEGAGQNMPARRYRIGPTLMSGGSMRILKAVHVPQYKSDSVDHPSKEQEIAVVLATDPLSPTAEHAFYLVDIDSGGTISLSRDPDVVPFLGGHVGPGSSASGGLGSVDARSVTVSPCGRRLAFSDKDGRICVVVLPNSTSIGSTLSYSTLPSENELGEPMSEVDSLVWSPGGRYLAISHAARNQFNVVSIADCGTPAPEAEIHVSRVVQATPSRFNSWGMYWGKAPLDLYLDKRWSALAGLLGLDEPLDVATTLFFLSDRDIASDVSSPWGSRAPSPHFPVSLAVYALPLEPVVTEGEDASLPGRFGGGGALESFTESIHSIEEKLKSLANATMKSPNHSRRLAEETSHLRRVLRDSSVSKHSVLSLVRMLNVVNKTSVATFPQDMDIDFGLQDLRFARSAYRLTYMPKGRYINIVTQAKDDGSLVITESTTTGLLVHVHTPSTFPSDLVKTVSLKKPLSTVSESTCRQFMTVLIKEEKSPRVVSSSGASFTTFISDVEGDGTKHVADTSNMGLSIWPQLEYQQMYGDAWRMLRDYFYDKNMHNVEWDTVFTRYKDLVGRCGKREELDDVLSQLSSELSALHVFVYGGEYNAPFKGQPTLAALHAPATLGANLVRAPDWKGYIVKDIPEVDLDFSMVDGDAVYSPLSDQTLRLTGQRGLAAGDVIVGINGESALSVPDIHMLLRGLAGRSVRLEVLRLQSGDANDSNVQEAVREPLVVVPISASESDDLRYSAWEWRTRQKAIQLASDAGFSVGYVHMRAMGRSDEDAFARGFFSDYDKQALIIDLRHNRGGNIDSWILTTLQKRAWMFWGDRIGVRRGSLDWDEQFAFRGHVVVLIDEHSSSDAEGLSRGISELQLGRLIGKRTWGGGIWLSSDNHLVDGGIATAPEIGTFNDNFGWGLGIEQLGVQPDVEVDNNPRSTFDGEDAQLEMAIQELRKWLNEEPIVEPKAPLSKPDKSIPQENCPAA